MNIWDLITMTNGFVLDINIEKLIFCNFLSGWVARLIATQHYSYFWSSFVDGKGWFLEKIVPVFETE